MAPSANNANESTVLCVFAEARGQSDMDVLQKNKSMTVKEGEKTSERHQRTQN